MNNNHENAHQDYSLAELVRIATNLIRKGTIEQINEKEYTTRIRSGDMLSDWIPIFTTRASADKQYWIPEEGEQGLILSPSGDPAQGYFLAGIFSDENPPNADNRDIYRKDFKNGSYIRHDRKTGDMHIVATGDLYIDAKNIYLNDPNFKLKERD